MSIVDKVIAAVTPPETEEQRHEARQTARAASTPGDWLAAILEHHEAIEGAFGAVKSATSAVAQRAAEKKLATLLTGHSMAEEAAIYPALSAAGETGHATMAYTEQSAAKMQLGLLERLEPLSSDYLDKLEHIRGAVLHHVYEEEHTWFLHIKEKAPLNEQARLTTRYLEEFHRYMGSDLDVSALRRKA